MDEKSKIMLVSDAETAQRAILDMINSYPDFPPGFKPSNSTILWNSIKDTQSIDLVIKLEEWDKDREYDRLGLEEEYTEFLGNRVVCHSLPIRPGRNLAVIVESAAGNPRQNKMGYNSAQEPYRRGNVKI